VLNTVAYSGALLRKFPGGRRLPLICPIVPFLDPDSRFLEEPAKHGYTISHLTSLDCCRIRGAKESSRRSTIPGAARRNGAGT
jgi:hypothetical protein